MSKKMKWMNRFAGTNIILSLLLLTGCSALHRTVNPTPDVYLSQQLQWQLPALDVLPGHYQLTQSVQATYGQDQFDLLFQVEKHADQLVMAALTPNGQPLMQMVYRNGQVEGSVSPLVGDNVSLAYLVSDFIIAFGQESQLQLSLKKAGAMLQSEGHSRVVEHNDSSVIIINYADIDQEQWPHSVHYKNIALGYELVIRTLNRNPL